MEPDDLIDINSKHIDYLILEFLDADTGDIDNLEKAARLICGERGSDTLKTKYGERLKDQILEFWEYDSKEFLSNADIISNYSSIDDLDDMQSDLEAAFSDYMYELLGEPVSDIETSRVFSGLDLESEAIDHWSGIDWDGEHGLAGSNSRGSEIDNINDLFDRN